MVGRFVVTCTQHEMKIYQFNGQFLISLYEKLSKFRVIIPDLIEWLVVFSLFFDYL